MRSLVTSGRQTLTVAGEETPPAPSDTVTLLLPSNKTSCAEIAASVEKS